MYHVAMFDGGIELYLSHKTFRTGQHAPSGLENKNNRGQAEEFLSDKLSIVDVKAKDRHEQVY
ncbi:MAG: hypothetical protein Q8Q50_16130 [Methylobacter sp.]|nr:hypothetical protein [Methylobacter sp.]